MRVSVSATLETFSCSFFFCSKRASEQVVTDELPNSSLFHESSVFSCVLNKNKTIAMNPRTQEIHDPKLRERMEAWNPRERLAALEAQQQARSQASKHQAKPVDVSITKLGASSKGLDAFGVPNTIAQYYGYGTMLPASPWAQMETRAYAPATPKDAMQQLLAHLATDESIEDAATLKHHLAQQVQHLPPSRVMRAAALYQASQTK